MMFPHHSDIEVLGLDVTGALCGAEYGVLVPPRNYTHREAKSNIVRHSGQSSLTNSLTAR